MSAERPQKKKKKQEHMQTHPATTVNDKLCQSVLKTHKRKKISLGFGWYNLKYMVKDPHEKKSPKDLI